MIIGSHNSWSYLPPKKWWMKLLKFTAKCQSKSISEQYTKYGVRCFDLRIRESLDGYPRICHGIIEYDIEFDDILYYLDYLNSKGDCYVRVIHEVRNKKDYVYRNVYWFAMLCNIFESRFPRIKFWCGRNLYNWEKDYNFKEEPSCEEKYSSVCPPNLIDDWWPWFYAKFHNKKIRKEGTDKEILLIDYVNLK